MYWILENIVQIQSVLEGRWMFQGMPQLLSTSAVKAKGTLFFFFFLSLSDLYHILTHSLK